MPHYAEQLLQASYQRDLPKLKFLLSQRVNPNVKNEFGSTPLAVCVEKNELEMVQLLLNAGADPNSTNATNKTPLYYAHSLEMLNVLSEKELNVNQLDNSGNSILNDAVLNDQLFKVQFLLDKNAVCDKTVLRNATKRGNYKIAKLLFEYCGRKTADFKKSEMIIYAYENSDFEMIELFSDYLSQISHSLRRKIMNHSSITDYPALKERLRQADEGERKILTVITVVPDGTLGDVSSAAKFIKTMQENYPNLSCNWLVVRKNSFDFNLRKFIVPFHFDGRRFHGVQTSNISGYNQFEIYDYRYYLMNTDLILSYPTHDQLSLMISSYKNYLYNFQVPVIALHEYDPAFTVKYNDKRYDVTEIYRPLELQTGLNDKALGIFVEQNILSPEENIEKIEETLHKESHPDHQFIKSLIGTNVNEYLQKNSLYFGYFNKQRTAYVNSVNVEAFIVTAIWKELASQKGHKVIDFVVNDEEWNIEALREKLKEIPVSLSYIDHRGQIISTESDPKNISIRIWSFPPLQQEIFKALLNLSDSFCSLTGDQSFSEGLHKVFLYQLMRWKKNMFSHFLKTIEKVVGKGSLLHRFYLLQENFEVDLCAEIKQLAVGFDCTVFFKTLEIEMAQVAKHVRSEKDLRVNAPLLIYGFIHNPVQTIQKLGSKLIESERDLNLTAHYFPQHITELCDVWRSDPNMSPLLADSSHFMPLLKKCVDGMQKKRHRSEVELLALESEDIKKAKCSNN